MMNNITPAANSSHYDSGIDFFKGIITIGMILSHVISVMGNSMPQPIVTVLNTVLQLQSFSAFVFAFGFTTQISYFSRQNLDIRRVIYAIIRIVSAFYISGIAFLFLIEKKYSFDHILSIITLSFIPILSEFIIAFALILSVAVLLKRPISWLVQRPIYFVLVNVCLLLSTFLPVQNIQSKHLGLLVGTSEFAAYPVLQYFPLFLLGIYFASHKINSRPLYLVLCTLGIILIEVLLSFWGTPGRFPPALGWIAGSIPFVLFWYFASRYVEKIPFLSSFLAQVGTNSLFFLVFSNLFFFTVPSILAQKFSLKYCIIITTILVSLIYYLTTIARRPRTSTDRSLPPFNQSNE
jgi:hypothetical protein